MRAMNGVMFRSLVMCTMWINYMNGDQLDMSTNDRMDELSAIFEHHMSALQAPVVPKRTYRPTTLSYSLVVNLTSPFM